jgi:ferredoxin
VRVRPPPRAHTRTQFDVPELPLHQTRILKENVPGQWYVDDSCTPCHVCLEEAPKLLKYNEDQTYVYFFKQPETPEEVDAAQRALDICPTGSIGSDNANV